MKLRKSTAKRMKRRLRSLQSKYVRGEVGVDEIHAVVQSLHGHVEALQ